MKKAEKLEKAEMEKMEKLLEKIESHPMTAKIREDQAAENLVKRREAWAKIEALQQEAASHNAKQVEIDALATKLKKLDDERRELQNAIGEKQVSLIRERQGIEGEIRQQQKILFSTYDTRIDEGIQFFRNKLDWLRMPGRIDRVGRKDQPNLITWTKITTAETNVPAIKSALVYCQNGIQELEKMKIVPKLDTEKIEALKGGIPKIDEFTEVTGIANMPGSRGINPRNLLPSDSEMDWKMGKLTEKFKKLIGK